MSFYTEMNAALVDLATATDFLARCETAFSTANKERCAASNRVNEAQKRLDELMATLKKSAPIGSDWKSGRRTTAYASEIGGKMP